MTHVTVLSLGAGVQSTVMALMAAKDEIGPLPDVCIFADTGWEPEAVYKHLDWLEAEIKRLTNGRMFVTRVSQGNICKDLLNRQNSTGQRFASIPYFTSGGGLGRRQCTREYKIQPIRKEIRRLLGVEKGKRVPKGTTVSTWVGISLDEIVRMKDSRDKWNTHRWPLIEERLNRWDCRQWFKRNYPGRKLGKSSCIGCPFHTNAMWRDMRDNDPVSWAKAVRVDKKIRNGGTLNGMNKQQFMHRSLVPLDEVDLRTLADLGQTEFGFDDECEGMCGT